MLKKLFFASSPWILVTSYVLERMGLNFYDYDGLQPKNHSPKHFSVVRTIKYLPMSYPVYGPHYMISFLNQNKAILVA